METHQPPARRGSMPPSKIGIGVLRLIWVVAGDVMHVKHPENGLPMGVAEQAYFFSLASAKTDI